MNMRLRRLYNDYQEVTAFLEGHPALRLVKAEGDPPEKYQFEYLLKGVEQKAGEVVLKDRHTAEITLTLDYPGQEPICRMLTPVFHPNIDPHLICITDRWAASESLTDVVLRIGRMLCYQVYNIKSPRNGEAAKWAAENLARFPLDAVDLDREAPPVPTAPERASKAAADGPIPAPAPGAKAAPPSVATPPSARKPRPAAEPQESIACGNCQTVTPRGKIRECRNGHLICPDCALPCSVCGSELCVQCEQTSCSACRKIVCPKCQDFCHFHREPVCHDHIVACGDCGVKGCDQCLAQCPGCGRHFCRAHFDKNRNLCASCQKIDTPQPLICPRCAKALPQGKAKFCPDCGQRLAAG